MNNSTAHTHTVPANVVTSGAFDGQALVATLPHAPGVYRMYDRANQLLYVGKAKDLKKRVGSYFAKSSKDPRMLVMVGHIAAMEFTVTRTESEALVLECHLIKTQHPRYNIALRDGRGYPCLRMSIDQVYPRLTLAYGKTPIGSRDFGPFPDKGAAQASLDIIQKTFLLRNCTDGFFANRSRPCLQYAIGRCSAPCVAMVSPQEYRQQVDQAIDFLEGRSQHVIEILGQKMDAASRALKFEDAAILRDRIALLSGAQAKIDVTGATADRDVVAAAISGDLVGVYVWYFRQGKASGSHAFFPTRHLGETPSEIMEQFLAQHYLGASLPSEIVVSPAPANQLLLEEALSAQAGHQYRLKVRVKGERARHLALARSNVEIALASKSAHVSEQHRRYVDMVALLELPAPPQRIECFDISHTSGEAAVASCVVFGPQGPRKSEYRHYNIAGITPGDDYAAMGQVLERRLRALKEHPEKERPDLWLIDGGEGQVGQAVAALARYHSSGIIIPVVGVSKGPSRKAGEETLVRPGHPPLHPGASSPGLLFIQFIRDESHRFAITGHRARRQATRNHSPLESIPGVGASKRAALLKAFGGIQGVKAAGVEELSRVPGIQATLAARIVQSLREH